MAPSLSKAEGWLLEPPVVLEEFPEPALDMVLDLVDEYLAKVLVEMIRVDVRSMLSVWRGKWMEGLYSYSLM